MPSLASPSHSGSASASPNPFEAYSCPKGKYKNCCMGIEQASHDILTPLGDVIPIVGGLKVSSAIAYQCMFSVPWLEIDGSATWICWIESCC
jgi:hypothetical protein